MSDYIENDDLIFANQEPVFTEKINTSGIPGSLPKTVDVVSLRNPSIMGFYSSAHFGEFFREMIHNPNCAYGSYLEGKIHKYQDIPNAIKILIKDVRSSECVFSDMACSRILNHMGIYTNYTSAHRNEITKECGAIDFDYFYSVYFEKEGYDFLTLSALSPNEFKDDYDLIDDWMGTLYGAVITYYRSKGMAPNMTCLRHFLEDVAMSYLVRITLLGDADCCFDNMGIYISKNDNTFYMSPNFDFEYAFHNRLINDSIRKDAFKNLEYCHTTFPRSTYNLMKNIRKYIMNNDINDIIASTISNVPYAEKCIRKVNLNAQMMMSMYKNIVNENKLNKFKDNEK